MSATSGAAEEQPRKSMPMGSGAELQKRRSWRSMPNRRHEGTAEESDPEGHADEYREGTAEEAVLEEHPAERRERRRRGGRPGGARR